MESGRCKVISFILSSLYRLTAFVGLMSIFIFGDAKLSGVIMASALILFASSYYIEEMLCKFALQGEQKHDPQATAEYQELVQHIESSRRR